MVVLDFGENGKLETGYDTREVFPIEEKLRAEYPEIFDYGFRFVMNCENNPGKIRRAIKSLNLSSRLIAISSPPGTVTFDTGKRVLEDCVAILVGPADVMKIWDR